MAVTVLTVREVISADSLATATFGNRYVFADLDQSQVSLTTRAQIHREHELSVQEAAVPIGE